MIGQRQIWEEPALVIEFLQETFIFAYQISFMSAAIYMCAME